MNKFADKLPKEIILGYLIYGIDKGKLHIVRRLVLHVSKYDNVWNGKNLIIFVRTYGVNVIIAYW